MRQKHQPPSLCAASFKPRAQAVFSFAACCLASGVFAPELFAAAVDGPEVRSSLNQPLRVRMALTLRDGEDLAPNCVRAVPPKRDDLPTAPGARASLQRDERGPYVLYTNAIAVTEPVIRGAVEVGCTDPVTREFVVLLDPPVINAPQTQSAAPSQPAAPAPSASSVASAPSVAPQRSIAAQPPVKSSQTRPRPAPPIAAATSKPAKPPKPKRPESASPKLADRLTLTAPDARDSSLLAPSSEGGGNGLKLSDLLTRLPQPSDAPADAEQSRRLVLEQARLAAILRDEDPVAAVMAKERELTERLTSTNRDLAAVRAQVKDLSERNRELERFSWLKWVAWALGGLLALGALFLGIRAIRNAWPRRVQKKEQEDPWWTAAPSTMVRSPVTSSVDNLYLDTIKPVPSRGAQAAALDAPTTTFETGAADSAHKIEVKELERSSTTFMREFEPAPETQPESFSTTIPQPTEFQRSAQPTRFQATKVQPVKPAVTPQPPQKPGPFPDTTPSPSIAAMPPLDFDLNLPPLDLDVSPPEDPGAKAQAEEQKTQASKSPAKP